MSIQNSRQIENVKVMLVKGTNGANIATLEKTGTSGLVDTYTITLTDGATSTFDVTNGSSIQSVAKTGTNGVVDTYTITLTDGSTSTFTVTNGENWINNSETTATDTFETITGGLIHACKVLIEPVQSGSGTPSPTNIRSIIGSSDCTVVRTGKNLWNPNEYFNGYIADATTISGSSTAKSAIIKCNPNTTYTISKPIGNRFRICYTKEYPAQNVTPYGFVDATGSTIRTITTGEDAKYIMVFPYTSASAYEYTWEDVQKSLQVEIGSTATIYNTYKGTEYTINLGGTIYGGELDVTSGVLTVNYSLKEFDGSNDETIIQLDTAVQDKKRFSFEVPDCKTYTLDADETTGEILSNQLVEVTNADTYGALNNGLHYRITDVHEVIVYIDGINSVSDMRAYLASKPLQVLYRLDESLTIQLTPKQISALTGNNYIYAKLNGQTVTQVQYRPLVMHEDIESELINNFLSVQNKVVMIGDSYLAGSNTTSPSTDNWGVLLKNLMGWNNVSRYPNAGGGYITQAGSGSFVDMVSDGGVVYTSENLNRLDVSLVICVGGINDGQVNTLTMFNAVKNFITNTKSLFPNAKIVLAYNWFCRNYPLGQLFGIKDACTQYDDVYFVEHAHMWLMNCPSYFTDGVHPNTDASKIASRIFAQWLRTGTDFCYGYPQTYSDNGITLTFWYDINNLNIKISGTTTGANDNTIMKNVPIVARPYSNKIGFSAYVGNSTQLLYIFSDGTVKNISGGYDAGTLVDGYATISNELLRYY